MSLAAGLSVLLRGAAAEVVLVHRGRPVTAPVAIAAWETRQSMLGYLAKFGPYAEAVEFDAVRLTVAGNHEDMPLGGVSRLAAGMEFEHDFAVRIGN